MKHIIGFPGLFEDRYVVDRVAFDLGKLFGSDEPMYVYWYGLIIVSAMLLAYVYFMLRAKRTEGIHEDHSMNLVIFALPLGVVGARTFYVLTNIDRFDSFKEAVLGIRDGGLAIYGGIVFGLITILVYCFVKKISCLKTLDAVSPAVMIAQAIGRWGNFFNAEAYGSSEGVKNFFLRMSIADYETPNAIKYVHPTFLYESLWNVLGFVIANIIYKKKKIDGQIFCFYLAWYGIGRGFIELLRTDSCMIFDGLFENDPLDFFGTAGADVNKPGIKAFVYLSLLLVIASVVLFVLLSKRQKSVDNELKDLKLAISNDEENIEPLSDTEENYDNDSDEKDITEPISDEEKNIENDSSEEENAESLSGSEENSENDSDNAENISTDTSDDEDKKSE